MLSEELGIKLENVTLQMLGRAKRVRIDKEATTIIDGAGDATETFSRIPAKPRGALSSGPRCGSTGNHASERARSHAALSLPNRARISWSSNLLWLARSAPGMSRILTHWEIIPRRPE